MIEVDPDSEFTGKYENEGRVGGMLVDAFYSSVRSLLVSNLASASTLLEVGCGAGYSSERILPSLPVSCSYLGCDIGATLLDAARKRNPAAEFIRQSAYSLALPNKSIDVIVMLEVLEHLDEPARALAELRRVATKCVIISTPREPLWRTLNFLRGKYVRDLGNTPGHVQHWSSTGLKRCVNEHFELIAMRQPVPWTILSLAPRA